MHDDQPTILLIDNDPDLIDALSARLSSEGYHCVTAATGAQGLVRFNDSDIDLVITDLNMPGGDGISLLNRLREESDVPVIVITGFRDDFRRELRDIENVTTLRKPFETLSLLSLIEAELTLSAESAPSQQNRSHD